MTEIQRYLAEEVAEDLADGIITRREAVRRLGLLGVTGAAATGLLATSATGKAAAAGSESPTDQDSASETSWAPVARESITFAGPRVPLLAAWAAAAKPRGGVLVIHENRVASVTELKRRLSGKKLAAIGFCFGGAMVWRLLAAGEPRLAAAAPFYGPFPEGGNLAGSRAAVLGVYGGLDSRVNATRPAAKAALEAAELKYELLTFTEADHAFSTTPGPASTRTPRRRFGVEH
jgi:carboxymethylenebutenolidase